MTAPRAKGKRGELDAARTLSSLTGLRWERTAQRWGADTADVWVPARPDLGLHVEVKLYAHGLQRFSGWTSAHRLVLTQDDVYACRLSELACVLREMAPPHMVRGTSLVERFVRQAERDARAGRCPVVLMRQDRGDWMVAWRYQDDDRLGAALLPLLEGVADAA